MQDTGEDGEEPRFVTEGLLDGTPVATPSGRVAVEDLSPGDLVLTFEGATPVVAVLSAVVEAGKRGWPQAHWPLLVPEGALGNRDELRLLPGQTLLLESDLAQAMFGDAFALVPAGALDGWRGIAPVAPDPVERVRIPMLDRDALVLSAGSLLLFCPADAEPGLPEPGRPGDWLPLSLAEGRALVAALRAAEAAPEGAAPEGQAALRAVSP